MSKNIFQFITPSQLTEKFRFSTRVLMSWAALGLGLGLIIGIVMITTKTSNSVFNDFLGCLFGFPVMICLFGLVGLGIDSMRGRDAYYDGWYWYLFPVVTYLVVGFWIALSIIGFTLALAGVRLPKISQKRPPKPEVDDFITSNSQQTGKNFLIKNPNFIPKNEAEHSIYEKFQSESATLEEIIENMNEDEYDHFIRMLLRLLGIQII